MQQKVQVGFTLTVQLSQRNNCSKDFTGEVSGVQRLNGNGRKAVIEAGCFGGHGSIAPTRAQQFEQVVGWIRWRGVLRLGSRYQSASFLVLAKAGSDSRGCDSGTVSFELGGI